MSEPSKDLGPALKPVSAPAALVAGGRQYFAGTTNSVGRARIDYTIPSGDYRYAVRVCAYEDLNGNSLPSGVGDAVFVIENLVIVPIEPGAGFPIQTTVQCSLVAHHKRDAGGVIQGNLYDHPAYQQTLQVAALLEWEA